MHQVFVVDGECASLQEAGKAIAASAASFASSGVSIKLRAFPKSTTLELTTCWERDYGLCFKPKGFTYVACVVVLPGRVLWSLRAKGSPPPLYSQRVHGGKRVNRAWHKLEEALGMIPTAAGASSDSGEGVGAAAGAAATRSFSLSRATLAIDVGAAPGGWTSLLVRIFS